MDKFTPEVLASLDGIKVISNVAVGYDNIDVPAATRLGILVTHTPDVLTDTTADFAFTLLMAAARRVVEGHHFVHSGQWTKWRVDLLVGQDVHHRTLGIFGMGRIGQAVARRAKGFSMRVIYYDSRRAPEAVEKELGLELVSAEQLLREADFVSLHVPLMPETRHMIGARELRMMKPTAILVNTFARAGGGRAGAGRGAGTARDRGRRHRRIRERAARPSGAAEAGERGAGAAYRQRVGGYAAQDVDDGGGECRGRDRRAASAESAESGGVGEARDKTLTPSPQPPGPAAHGAACAPLQNAALCDIL